MKRLLALAAILCLVIGCQKPDLTVKTMYINPSSVDMLVGTTASLSVTLDPANASNGTYSWSSDNSAVASVDQSGTVTALKDGTATIKATLEDGSKSAFCKVNVTDPGALKGISVSPSDITCGVTYKEKLTVTFTPETAKNKKVTWKSSDNAIATVSSSGEITALKVGSATITATSDEGGYTSTCKITVKEAEVYYKSGAYDYFVNGKKYTNSNCPDGILHWFYSDGDHRYEGIATADPSKEGIYKDGTIWLRMNPAHGYLVGVIGEKLFFFDRPRNVSIYDNSKGDWIFDKNISDKNDVNINDVVVGPDGTTYIAGHYQDKTHNNGGGAATLWTISSDQKTVTETIMHNGSTYEYTALSVTVDSDGHVWVLTNLDSAYGNGGMKLYKDGKYQRVIYKDNNGNFTHYIRSHGNDLYVVTGVGAQARTIRVYQFKNGNLSSQTIAYTITHPNFFLPDNLFISKNGDVYFSAHCHTDNKSYLYKNGQELYSAEMISSMAVVY